MEELGEEEAVEASVVNERHDDTESRPLWESGDDHQKYLTWFYIVSAFVLFIVYAAIFQTVVNYGLTRVFSDATWAFQLERFQEQFHVGLGDIFGVVAALSTAFYCRFNPTVNGFGLEVVAELKKMTWSSMEVTWKSTLAVIVTVFICAVILGLFDLLWSALSRWLLQ